MAAVALAGCAVTLAGSVEGDRVPRAPEVRAYAAVSESRDETRFVQALRADADLDPVSERHLLAAGRAACAALDRRAPHGDVLLAVAGTAPAARSMRAVRVVVQVAAESLCPDHAT